MQLIYITFVSILSAACGFRVDSPRNAHMPVLPPTYQPYPEVKGVTSTLPRVETKKDINFPLPQNGQLPEDSKLLVEPKDRQPNTPKQPLTVTDFTVRELALIWRSFRQCQQEYNISEEEFKRMHVYADFSRPSANAKCYSYCVLQAGGTYANGLIDEDLIFERLMKRFNDAAVVRGVMRKCDLRSSNNCDTSYIRLACYHKEQQKLGLRLPIRIKERDDD